MLTFHISKYSPDSGRLRNAYHLATDSWDDFGFKTLFSLSYYDANGEKLEIGAVKIGKHGMISGRITDELDSSFTELDKDFFSLGQSSEYYESLLELEEEIRREILVQLRDIAFDDKLYEYVKFESVTSSSLMRNITEETVTNQYRRLARGGDKKVQYGFEYTLSNNSKVRFSTQSIDFVVIPDSRPPSNIHVIIGRNGVGKTTLLKNINRTLINGNESSDIKFINSQYNKFSSIVYVSFSAFDDIDECMDEKYCSNKNYTYIGLKKVSDENDSKKIISTKSLSDIMKDFSKSFLNCKGIRVKRLESALNALSYDPLFSQAGLGELAARLSDHNDSEIMLDAKKIFERLSSGHKIVLLTVTKLIEKVEEGSLILFDEPESHLHPPLLSALIRVISEFLIDRNAVALLATHSPVVLQEVPRSCAWIINRTDGDASVERPEIETFGENVGNLTREVFSFEVLETGFHRLIVQTIERGDTYDDVIGRFDGKLGGDAKALAKLLLNSKKTWKTSV